MNILTLFPGDLIKSIKEEYIKKDDSIYSKSIWYSSVCTKFPEFKSIFEKNFNKSLFKSVIYCILRDIQEIPECKNPECSNKVSLRNYKVGFQKYCCKECIAKYQSVSETFKKACSDGAKIHQKQIHKETFIDKYQYNCDGNYYNIYNYCKHGNIKIYKKTALNINNYGQSTFCMKCNEELFNSYIPSENEILEFQKSFKSFFEKYNHNIKWSWWIMYFPKQLKIIISYFEKYVEKFDKNTNDLKECYYQFLHDLKGRPHCTVCNNYVSFCNPGNSYRKFCDDHLYGYNKSSMEYDLNEYIKSLNVEFQLNANGIIKDELDIYFPNNNFAIEFNGCWWHCDKFKDDKYHYNKWKECIDKGIQLMYICEDDWNNKNEIIKSLIKSKLGIYKHRIYARNCELHIVSAKETKNFLNTYHLQGYSIDKHRLGLYYKGTLVSIMTFGKSRFKNSNDIEIIRYCCKPDYQIIGGANKLFKNYNKLYNFDGTNIISYADADISVGTLYEKLGMKYIQITKNWKWLYRGIRYNRLNKIRFDNKELYKCYSVGTLKYSIK